MPSTTFSRPIFRTVFSQAVVFGAFSITALTSNIGWSADFFYLSENSVDWKKILPPPPSSNSAEEVSEFTILRSLQETRTAADAERAKSEKKLSVASYQGTFGEWFTEANLPKLFALCAKIEKDEKHFADVSKDFFQRPRPGIKDKKLKTVFDAPKSFAYPSGHSSHGYMFAVVLCELAPDKKDALLERGREIGWDRVIAGVHFPSDVAAGRVLGQAVGQAFLANESFQRDFAEAKVEFAQVSAAKGSNATSKNLQPVGAN